MLDEGTRQNATSGATLDAAGQGLGHEAGDGSGIGATEVDEVNVLVEDVSIDGMCGVY